MENCRPSYSAATVCFETVLLDYMSVGWLAHCLSGGSVICLLNAYITIYLCCYNTTVLGSLLQRCIIMHLCCLSTIEDYKRENGFS